jgi:hypothetical protein
MASGSRHGLSRRTRKLSHRAGRVLLFVEQLEKRVLLNGSRLLTSPSQPLFNNQGPALPNPLGTLPAGFVQGRALPSGVPQQHVGSLPGQTLPALPQPPVSLLPGGVLPGPAQKSPANSKTPTVNVPLVVGPDQSATPDGLGYTPRQLRQAYGFNQIPLPAGETFNDAGRGQTIAIIDALNDPNIVSDLQTFDETFHIGGTADDPTSTNFFKVVNENGGSTLPATDNTNYGLETSLDVEWAHAMAPGAKIMLVELSTFFNFNDLGTALEFAASQPHVSVVSMSFGFSEWPTEYYFDNLYTTPSGHQGVSFVTSAGDSGGFVTSYQAMSPNVLSVGGTTLPADASGKPDRALEYGWADGGGGVSVSETEPAYQLGVQSTGLRTGPDLAYDSDPDTGVPVYDTLYANAFSPGEPWFRVGGTSIAAPQISSMVAITNQLRVAAGEGTLDGPNQLLPAIYQIAATDPNAFHDITKGNNGYAAGPGYDFVTGVGTPNAQYLVPDLVAAFSSPATPATLYWTGDAGDENWDSPGNWSTVDPLVTNVQQSVLPAPNDNVVVDLPGAVILHNTSNYETISSFTVTAPNVALNLGFGTLDLSGGGTRGKFQVDQPGDIVAMEGAVLKGAHVTAGTTLSASSALFSFFSTYTEYPELNDVRLDGTLNANQSFNNNGIYFQNGLILNGTINLGGTNDVSSVLLAGYGDGVMGNQDNNPEKLSGTGTIQLGQSLDGDALYNWGTLGTFTIGPHITVLGGGPGSLAYFEQTNLTGGLDNQGTFEENGGSLQIDAFGPALFNWEPSSTTGWTNEGVIEATGATLSLLGGWINYGTISADSASTVLLGNPTVGQVASSPNAPYYAWSSFGSLTIGNGATVVVGGFLTTDQYQGAAGIPGVSANLAADSLSLDGTLDNRAADNTVSDGVLAVNAATGPLRVIGGTINGGSITTSGSDNVQVLAITVPNGPLGFPPVALAGGWLYNLTNDGTVDVTGAVLTLSNATNNGTLNATTGAAVVLLSNWDNAIGVISIDSSSSLYLGAPASTDPNFPPTLADGSPYAWSLSSVGTMTVANGATIGFGGLITTDQFTAFPSLPGVRIALSQDTVLLDGWLDNSPNDNPHTRGVLALTSATGTVDLASGFVSRGSITSSGTGALNVISFGGPLNLSGGVMNSVTNDGAIGVNGAVLYLEKTVVNNGTLTNSSGTIDLLQRGNLTNSGSITLTAGLFESGSSVTNNGTITLTSGSVMEIFPFLPQDLPVSLANTGTIALTGFSELILEGSLTNAGTISSLSSAVALYGNWDNTKGTISVDSSSELFLGRPTALDPNFPPPIADASPYAFNPSKVGRIIVSNGAAIGFGGLMTTDQFNAFPNLPGVSISLSADFVMLDGWLDNSRAHNPISHGVLAITSATGLLYLDGGYIYRGKITTSGTNHLEADPEGFLDGVELDGTLDVTPFGIGEIVVLNSLVLNGTIDMTDGFQFGELVFGDLDNAAETISGTGTISLGDSSTFEAIMADLSNTGLTIGSGITINAGALFSYIVAEGSTIDNLGTIEDNTFISTLFSYGVNGNTGLYEPFSNFSSGTLRGGTWDVANGATWQSYGLDLTTNAANLTVSGAGTQIMDYSLNNGLAGFATNRGAGSFTVGAGYDFTAPGTFSNAGVVDIQGGAGFSAGSSNYRQSDGMTTVDGTLTAANVLMNGGSLNGTGTIAGNLTNAAVVTPGDAPGTLTIEGNYKQTGAGALDINLAGPATYSQLAVTGMATLAGTLNVALVSGFTPAAGASFTILTFAARSGNFHTETGLRLGKNKVFVPSFESNDLTLVLNDNTTNANTLDAGRGLDWFWVIYGNDSTNRKATDLLN